MMVYQRLDLIERVAVLDASLDKLQQTGQVGGSGTTVNEWGIGRNVTASSKRESKKTSEAAVRPPSLSHSLLTRKGEMNSRCREHLCREREE
jgi:hypothetical protein